MTTPTVDAAAVDLGFEDRLRAIIDERRARASGFALPYVYLWESIADIVSRGKRLRPQLVLDVYAALGGVDGDASRDVACAIELLHVALIIHDDVIDKDDVRRGERNITGRSAMAAVGSGVQYPHAQNWGEASSILAGDLLLTTAQSLIARVPTDAVTSSRLLDIFDEALFTSAAGEHADVWLSLHVDVASSYEVLAAMEHKTAAYSFRAPLLLAATLAGADADVHELLSAVGTHLGVIYQLRDDVLGVFGDEQATGKSTLSDLREGKETLLISFARAHEDWSAVAAAFGDPALSIADSEKLRHIIVQSGALELVESLIADHRERVHELLDGAPLPDRLRVRLESLAEFCGTRRA